MKISRSRRGKRRLARSSRSSDSHKQRIRKSGLLFRGGNRPSVNVAQTVATTEYGTKAAGLLRLPACWCPPFIALPIWLYHEWMNSRLAFGGFIRRKRGLAFSSAIKELLVAGARNLIVRSSAVEESMNERGRYKSFVVPSSKGVDGVAAAIEKIYQHFSKDRSETGIGVVIQVHCAPVSHGHLSNEVHLSPTRNQWKYVVEGPAYAPSAGLNTKFASPLNSRRPIHLLNQKSIPSVLRQVGAWVNGHAIERSHIEWCMSDKNLWLVQWDLEDEVSDGVNPLDRTHLRDTGHNRAPILSAEGVFSLYKVGSETPWKKLSNVDDFQTSSTSALPRLYFATAFAIDRALSAKNSTGLDKEIARLTGNRAVLRTDSISEKLSGFNLPRTQTVSGDEAVIWLAEKLQEFKKKGASFPKLCFVLHQYIPAQACAWAYFEPGSEFVQVDSLWGLPDGLQFLPHDTFYVSASKCKVTAERVRYKPQFLQEQDDGTWKYVSVARQFGRHKSLSTAAIRHIAAETVEISKTIGTAQIMWFCDIPEELGLGAYLPWYRSREELQNVKAVNRPPYRVIEISSYSDIQKLKDRIDQNLIIRISPAAELVREDDKFLSQVIELAKTQGFPVEIAGSILGHAFYRLRNEGLIVLEAEPYASHIRTRGRKSFGKIVRDEIPRNIAAKGETVVQAQLSNRHIERGLVAKLLEEAMEYLSASKEKEKQEELADILEVVRGMVSSSGFTWDEISAVADKKRILRGGFEQQTVLLETSFPKTSPSILERGKAAHAIQAAGPATRGELSLDQLGTIRVQKDSVLIPFTKIISPTGIVAANIRLAGNQVDVSARFEGTGIRISVAPTLVHEELPEAQLSLRLEPARAKLNESRTKKRKRPVLK